MFTFGFGRKMNIIHPKVHYSREMFTLGTNELLCYDGKIYLYGGIAEDGKYLNNLQQFNPENEVWTRIDVTGDKPSERTFQTCCLIGSRMFMFGGYYKNEIFNELYSLELKM